MMGVPAVMVDENGNRIPGEVPYDDIIATSGPPLESCDAEFYRYPNFARLAIRPTCRTS